jgi:hypothetical protein
MDLATRVPSTRPALVEEMGTILSMRSYRDATKLLLSALYIIAEYSENSDQLSVILTPNVLYCDERVQVSVLSTAFKLYVKCDTPTAFAQAEDLFNEQLGAFKTGIYAEVQDIAVQILSLVEVLKGLRETEAFEELKSHLTEEYDEDNLPELEVPEELNEPDEDFKCSDDDDDDFLKEPEIDDIVEQTAAEVQKQVKKEAKKPKIKVRKQKNVDREKIVIKTSKKSLLQTATQEKKQDALADAFANIDLTQEEPVQAIAPKQYGTPKAPVVLEKKSAAPKLRTKRSHKDAKENTEEEKKKKSEPPVSGPLEGSRMQKLCDTESITVTALEFVPEKQAGQLTINLEITNKTKMDISSVGIEVVSESITGINILPTTAIEPRKKVTHSITIEVPNPSQPTIAKVRFIPVSASADSIDADIKVFPSFFLIPGKVSEIDALTLEEKDSYSLVLTAKPREMLQRMVNVLRGPIIPQSVKTAKLIYAKTSDDKHITALLSLDGQTANVEVSSEDKKFAEVICKELKMKTTPLSK